MQRDQHQFCLKQHTKVEALEEPAPSSLSGPQKQSGSNRPGPEEGGCQGNRDSQLTRGERHLHINLGESVLYCYKVIKLRAGCLLKLRGALCLWRKSAKDRFTELFKVKEEAVPWKWAPGGRTWDDFTPWAGAGLQGKLASLCTVLCLHPDTSTPAQSSSVQPRTTRELDSLPTLSKARRQSSSYVKCDFSIFCLYFT